MPPRKPKDPRYPQQQTPPPGKHNGRQMRNKRHVTIQEDPKSKKSQRYQSQPIYSAQNVDKQQQAYYQRRARSQQIPVANSKQFST
jgi:hypothetical protein